MIDNIAVIYRDTTTQASWLRKRLQKYVFKKSANSLEISKALIKVTQQRDEAIIERDEAILELDNAIIDRDDALKERDDALQERDDVLRERDDARDEITVL